MLLECISDSASDQIIRTVLQPFIYLFLFTVYNYDNKASELNILKKKKKTCLKNACTWEQIFVENGISTLVRVKKRFFSINPFFVLQNTLSGFVCAWCKNK